MVTIGTPNSSTATKVVLCGSGELGKEFVIELQRYGVEVIALDRYPNAPAMQVAHRSYVLSMLDGEALRRVIEKEKPDYIVPEVEAIATGTLMELEKEGYHVIPTARATWLTMNREGIRRLAAEELGLPTSPYRFAATEEEFREAVRVIGMPCVVKPIMSSSGHGQSVIRKEEEIDPAWRYAQEGGRAGAGKVIVEGFVDFDYEITQLTVRHIGGTSFLEPVGHVQVDGDYRESWQPQAMSPVAREKAREIAGKVTEALGGRGLFGVELFVKDGARLRYSTIENWSKNMYNLNTKRATIGADAKMEWVSGSFGSHVSYLYPTTIMAGDRGTCEFTGITFAGATQDLDTGCKVIMNGADTTASVSTKSISKDGGVNTFRSSVVIGRHADRARCSVSCQSLMLDDISRSDTIPAMDVRNATAQVGHEATIGRISDDTVLYLMSRGCSEAEARTLVVNGFANPVSKELPMEYAVEMNNLIKLEMEGAIG